MATTTRVKILRPLNGDDGKGGNKRWERGEYRTMDPADASRLADTGAVEIIKTSKKAPVRQSKKVKGAKPKAKAAAKPKNKAAPKPKNKSAS